MFGQEFGFSFAFSTALEARGSAWCLWDGVTAGGWPRTRLCDGTGMWR